MDKQINNNCSVCGQSEGKSYEYFTALETEKRSRPRRKGSTKIEYTYSEVEKHSDFVCDTCRNNDRKLQLKYSIIIFIVAVALITTSILLISFDNNMGFWGSVGALALIPSIIFVIVALVQLFRAHRTDGGSEALCSYYLKKSTDKSPKEIAPGITIRRIAVTPKEAKNKGIIDNV